MIEKKILLLLDNDDDMFARLSRSDSVDVRRSYKKHSIIVKIFRRLHMVSKLPHYDIWYSDWKYDLDRFDLVIMHASTIRVPIIRYIHRKDSRKRIILWYWNPVKMSVDPDKIPDQYCEKWSFDIRDCERYGMKFNSQFYFDKIKLDDTNNNLYDVLFVGKNKGRYETIMNYKKIFTDLGLKCRFMIMPTNTKSPSIGSKYSNNVSYKKIISMISSSKAILDIVNVNQSGLTLRPMESIFLKRKLITNFKQIKEYDFYNKNNIFILNEDDIKKLPEFIESPYCNIPESIINKYNFDNWIERFIE